MSNYDIIYLGKKAKELGFMRDTLEKVTRLADILEYFNTNPILKDNLCNSNEGALEPIKEITDKQVAFYKIDVTDEEAVDSVFSNHSIDGIIHFAGLKAVGESVEKPIDYYYNNTVSTMVLARMCLMMRVLAFSCGE